MSNKKLVTVIIPVYNVERYLVRCVDSVLAQTYKNLEIILVDDGSPDSCPAICDEYTKKDQRISVIHHSTNKGVAVARNNALDIHSGSFVFFVDGDDYIGPNTIKSLYELLGTYNSDVAICGYTNCYNTSIVSYVDSAACSKAAKLFSGEDSLENMLYQKEITTSPWGKLFRSKLIKHVRFPANVKVGEDLGTIYKLLSQSNRVALGQFVGYYYQQRQDSAVKRKFSVERMEALYFTQQIVDFVRQNHPAIMLSAKNRSFMEAVFVRLSMHPDADGFASEKKQCSQIIRNYRMTIIFDKKSRLVPRLYALASFAGQDTIVRLDAFKKRLKGGDV